MDFLMALFLKPPTKRKVLDPAINSNLQPKTEKDLNTNFAKKKYLRCGGLLSRKFKNFNFFLDIGPLWKFFESFTRN